MEIRLSGRPCSISEDGGSWAAVGRVDGRTGGIQKYTNGKWNEVRWKEGTQKYMNVKCGRMERRNGGGAKGKWFKVGKDKKMGEGGETRSRESIEGIKE